MIRRDTVGEVDQILERLRAAKALVVVALLVSAPAFAASDIFAKIGDIKGESQDSKHKDWIEVSSFSWGMNNVQTNNGKVHNHQIHKTILSC